MTENEKVYIGVYKDEELKAVMEWVKAEFIDTETVDTFHDMGFILKKINKEDYDNFVNQEGIEWEDLPPYDGIIDIDLT
jgi:hypothetical protein